MQASGAECDRDTAVQRLSCQRRREEGREVPISECSCCQQSGRADKRESQPFRALHSSQSLTSQNTSWHHRGGRVDGVPAFAHPSPAPRSSVRCCGGRKHPSSNAPVSSLRSATRTPLVGCISPLCLLPTDLLGQLTRELRDGLLVGVAPLHEGLGLCGELLSELLADLLALEFVGDALLALLDRALQRRPLLGEALRGVAGEVGEGGGVRT